QLPRAAKLSAAALDSSHQGAAGALASRVRDRAAGRRKRERSDRASRKPRSPRLPGHGRSQRRLSAVGRRHGTGSLHSREATAAGRNSSGLEQPQLRLLEGGRSLRGRVAAVHRRALHAPPGFTQASAWLGTKRAGRGAVAAPPAALSDLLGATAAALLLPAALHFGATGAREPGWRPVRPRR